MPSKAARATEELGTRSRGPLLWWSCTQTTISVAAYGVYALTNAFFVSRGAGETALAAVNLVAPLLLLLGAVSTTMGVGGASLVSRRLGAGDHDGAARAAGTCLTFFWLTALATTAVGLAGLDPLLRAVGATDATLPLAHDYAQIILAGAVLSTGFSSLVRAEGRLGFSTVQWLAPVIVQALLDPVLIMGAGWGVRGAAVATVAAQGLSAGMGVWFFLLQRGRPYTIRPSDLRPHGAELREILVVGAPSFLSGLGTTTLATIVNAALAAVGPVLLAAWAECSRIQTFVAMPQTGVAQGAQPVVSYNAGLGLVDRVSRAASLSVRATLVYGMAAAGAVALAAPALAAVFLPDATAADEATGALRVLAVGVAAQGVVPLVSALYQAVGRSRPAYLLSVGTLLAVRLPLVALLAGHGAGATWAALVLGDVVSAVVGLVMLWRSPVGASAGED